MADLKPTKAEVKAVQDELEALHALIESLEHGYLMYRLEAEAVTIAPDEAGTLPQKLEGRFVKAFVSNFLSGKRQRVFLTEALYDEARECARVRRIKLERYRQKGWA